ncbi:MAG: hypothetical protein RJA70_284 [Pseudomonadota bacterium]|jgi:hypothetical protein
MNNAPTEPTETSLPAAYEAPRLKVYGTLLELTQSGDDDGNENEDPFVGKPTVGST